MNLSNLEQNLENWKEMEEQETEDKSLATSQPIQSVVDSKLWEVIEEEEEEEFNLP